MKKHITKTGVLFFALATQAFGLGHQGKTCDSGEVGGSREPLEEPTREPIEDPGSPIPDAISIRNIVYNGSGCPLGSVGSSIRDDSSLGFSLDEFYAESGPGIARSETRKFCQLTLALDVPEGFSYAIYDVDHTGYADIPSGVKGNVKTSIYFQGASGRNNQVDFSGLLRGPFEGEFEITDNLGLDALVWSPCNQQRAVNIKTSISLMGNRDRYAFMTLDKNLPYNFNFKVKWKRCN